HRVRRRRQLTAVSEGPEHVDADVVDRDEEDVRRLPLGLGVLGFRFAGGAPAADDDGCSDEAAEGRAKDGAADDGAEEDGVENGAESIHHGLRDAVVRRADRGRACRSISPSQHREDRGCAPVIQRVLTRDRPTHTTPRASIHQRSHLTSPPRPYESCARRIPASGGGHGYPTSGASPTPDPAGAASSPLPSRPPPLRKSDRSVSFSEHHRILTAPSSKKGTTPHAAPPPG